MNDILYEQTMKRTLSRNEKLVNVGILIAGVVGIIVFLVIFPRFFVLPAMIILTAEYYVLPLKSNIEVEYSFFDHVLDISYIYNKQKRKTKLELDTRSAVVILPTDSEEIDDYHSKKEMDFSSGEKDRRTYSVMVRKDGALNQVIIEPDDELLMLLKASVGKRV